MIRIKRRYITDEINDSPNSNCTWINVNEGDLAFWHYPFELIIIRGFGNYRDAPFIECLALSDGKNFSASIDADRICFFDNDLINKENVKRMLKPFTTLVSELLKVELYDRNYTFHVETERDGD